MIEKSSLLGLASNICAHGFFQMEDQQGNSQSAAFIESENFDVVSQRRARMVEQLGLNPGPVMSMKQIHSNKVVVVEENWERGQGPQADGFVTKTPGIILGILTADCSPLLFVDPQNRVIGACHAGWLGAFSGVVENTLIAMEKLGAQRHTIHVALGPTIQQQSYEVGPEFPLKALKAPDIYSEFFIPSKRPNHHMFDLPAFLRKRLTASKIRQFQDLNLNTYTGPFFSRRRCVAEKQAYDKKSNLSVIALL